MLKKKKSDNNSKNNVQQDEKIGSLKANKKNKIKSKNKSTLATFTNAEGKNKKYGKKNPTNQHL